MVLDSSLLNDDGLKTKQERYQRVPGSLASAAQKALLLVLTAYTSERCRQVASIACSPCKLLKHTREAGYGVASQSWQDCYSLLESLLLD